jgi:hypothetical protein
VTAPEESPGGLAQSTGHPHIDEAVIALAATQDSPPADQVAPLAEAHRTLRETLDSIDDI